MKLIELFLIYLGQFAIMSVTLHYKFNSCNSEGDI